MEPKLKKIKLDEPIEAEEETKLKFLDLNDDCIFAIFERISLDDLCSMTFTCNRLRDLAFDHFKRKHPNEYIVISVKYSRVTGKFPVAFANYQPKYLKYFTKYIQNVELVGDRYEVKRLFNFIKEECCINLKTLDLYISAKLDSRHGKQIADQLNGLERLTIQGFRGTCEIYNGLLKYCKNLNSLTIKPFWDGTTDWMDHEYPTLKKLNLQFQYDLNHLERFKEMANEFFRKNPQIKDFTCGGIVLVKAILQNVNDIERLVIDFYENENPNDLVEDLKIYHRKSPIKSLELNVLNFDATQKIDELINLNVVHPINGINIHIQHDVDCTAIMHLKQLKQLKLHFSNSGLNRVNVILNEISKNAPKLYKVELTAGYMFINDKRAILFTDLSMPFVQNSLELKELTLDFGHTPIKSHQNDLIRLNAVRKIREASRMIISIKQYSNLQDALTQENFYTPSECMIDLKFESSF